MSKQIHIQFVATLGEQAGSALVEQMKLVAALNSVFLRVTELDGEECRKVVDIDQPRADGTSERQCAWFAPVELKMRPLAFFDTFRVDKAEMQRFAEMTEKAIAAHALSHQPTPEQVADTMPAFLDGSWLESEIRRNFTAKMADELLRTRAEDTHRLMYGDPDAPKPEGVIQAVELTWLEMDAPLQACYVDDTGTIVPLKHPCHCDRDVVNNQGCQCGGC